MRIVLISVALVLALVFATFGTFAPWVAHKAAALVLTGQDMAEFVKFLPEVRSGEMRLTRQVFYLPLLAGAVGLVLAAANRRLRIPWPVRWLLTLLAVPVSLSMLPPAWTPRLMLSPEFRLQGAVMMLCLMLAALGPLLRRLRPPLLEVVTAGLAVSAAAVPMWQFLRVRPAIDAVYGTPVDLGWGLWATAVGFGLVAVSALLALVWGGEEQRTPEAGGIVRRPGR